MADLYLPPLCTIHPWSPEAMGPQLNAWNQALTSASSTAWQVANRGYVYPFKLYVPTVVRGLWVYNGATVSGNVDVGIYTEDGTKIVSTGSTAQAGTNAVQSFSISTTTIGPGRFLLALNMNNTTGTVRMLSTGSGPTTRFMGKLRIDSAFPLPATITPATSDNFVAVFGLSTRSLI